MTKFPYNGLVVDDDGIIQTIHQKYLESLYCSVDTVGDGKSALEKFFSKTYHIVLLDYHLPDMLGTELCQMIRKYEQEKDLMPTPIIMITSDPTAKEKALLAGCNDFHSKPVNQKSLWDILDRWLSARHEINEQEIERWFEWINLTNCKKGGSTC